MPATAEDVMQVADLLAQPIQVNKVGLPVHFAVSVAVVFTGGDVELPDTVHTGFAVDGAFCQSTLTDEGKPAIVEFRATTV